MGEELGGIFAALCVVGVFMTAVHVTVAVGLWNGKRLALLGAIVLASFHAFPSLIALLAAVPLGHFSDMAQLFLPVFLFHGGVLGYLSMNKAVRATFR